MDKSKIEAARAALQHMDDFAMMSCAVDPVGPRGVLEQFIAEVERLAGTDAVYLEMVPVAGGLQQAGDDLLASLQRAIDGAEHKPGQWAGSITEMGGVCTPGDTLISNWGNFSFKRDAWLAIAAVNALPDLMERVRSAEKSERAADQEVERLRAELERLRATLPATTTCCGDPGDCTQPCEAERKPSAKTARALEQAREIRERLAGDELPDGLSWDQAPEWAVCLLYLDAGALSYYAWADGLKHGACVLPINHPHYKSEGRAAMPSGHHWKLIAHRPTQKAPCTDCGACVGGPHGCGKPGLHGKAEPADDGWIEWNGGECPVTEGTLVDVWHFDGEVVCEVSALESGAAYDWSHATPHKDGDIIAYRLHRPATPRRDATQN